MFQKFQSFHMFHSFRSFCLYFLAHIILLFFFNRAICLENQTVTMFCGTNEMSGTSMKRNEINQFAHLKKKKMNCHQANEINIIDYLINNNHKPVKTGINYALFHAPHRIDKNPSFIVYKNTNRWKDLARGDMGTLIDLIVIWKSVSPKEALEYVNDSPSNVFFLNQQEYVKEENDAIKIRQVKSTVQHKALLDYMKFRKIDPDKVKYRVKEIWYTVNGKIFFSIGFKNNNAGYELRNEYFKNCIGKKTITTIRENQSKYAILLEGFFDYLSIIMLNWNPENYDVVVLNSTSEANESIPELKKYDKVYSYLDNDDAGKECFEFLNSKGINIEDCSHRYKGFKDVNDYLVNGTDV